MASTANHDVYFIPEPSKWPVVGTISLTTTVIGAVTSIHAGEINLILPVGLLMVAYLFFGWFGAVIKESMSDCYNEQVDKSFRIGMLWFIFSEVMFFAAFFGALFYARNMSIPWLGGSSNNFFTNLLLWQGFESTWPTNGPGNVGGDYQVMGPVGLPLINTALLLTSSITVTIAHHALIAGKRSQLALFLAATFILGFVFVGLQAYEYVHAYQDLNLRMTSGIYGSTFFMLTGFHGMHVTIGAIMLTTIFFRVIKGHFTPEKHFAFEAVAWYWHFVDVVWIGLYVFVYWM